MNSEIEYQDILKYANLSDSHIKLEEQTFPNMTWTLLDVYEDHKLVCDHAPIRRVRDHRFPLGQRPDSVAKGRTLWQKGSLWGRGYDHHWYWWPRMSLALKKDRRTEDTVIDWQGHPLIKSSYTVVMPSELREWIDFKLVDVKLISQQSRYDVQWIDGKTYFVPKLGKNR